jgi:thiol:disulfide interchange protein DsbC
MIFQMIRPLLMAALVIAAPLAIAEEAVDEAQVAKLRSALEIPSMGLEVGSVKTTEIAGMFEVQLVNGPLIYSDAQGSHFIVGDLYSVGPQGYVNLGEQRRDGARAEQLAAVEVDDMIVFSPEGEPRAFVTVFTDVTCFYCQKLHKEVPELNKRGVEVRYLAYPRAGVGSDGFKQLASAWCADDRQQTLTSLKNKKAVPENVCADNPIAAQYRLGQEMGVRGTPAIITQDGQMIPGYQSADDLMVTLGLN